MADLIIESERVVTPTGVRPAAVVVDDGRIVSLEPRDYVGDAREVHDVSSSVVMAGLVDSHVHINEPGRAHWEGFATATRAAAAGGVTTLIDMPLNSVPLTVDGAGLAAKREAATGQCHVDCGFWGGVVPYNRSELAALHEAGVLGFKCFLVHSGIDGFENVTEKDLRPAMTILGELGAPLLAHAEWPAELDDPLDLDGDPTHYGRYLTSRPPAAETAAIALLLELAAETGCRLHIVHVACAEALPLIRRARADGVPVTAETCPHYLTMTAAEIGVGETLWKCAPPIRDDVHRDALWDGLASGALDLVASDHSPAPPDVKELESGDILAAWGGISSLGLTLPVMWTECRRRGVAIDVLARWLSEEPADLGGLSNKGSLTPGRDADIVIWNPDARWTVREGDLHTRHRLCPYVGRSLYGVVERTFLRGRCVYDHGEFPVSGHGRLLERERETGT